MSDITNLNKRDIHCYYNFLKQAKVGFNNVLLDKSFNMINNFILNKYNSLDLPIYSLEDFIQECFEKIIKYNTVMSTTTINRVYNKLRNMDNRQSKIEEVSMEEYSINYDSIYFKMFMTKIIPMLEKESYQKVLSTIIYNNDLSIDEIEFGLSRQRISQIKIELFRRIKWNKEFMEYYSDYKIEANKYYEQQLKNFSLEEYICSPRQLFRKEAKELIIKYIDNVDSLSKEELEDVLDILYRVGRRYYEYHSEEIHKRIGKIKRLIFNKSI